MHSLRLKLISRTINFSGELHEIYTRKMHSTAVEEGMVNKKFMGETLSEGLLESSIHVPPLVHVAQKCVPPRPLVFH